MSADTEIGTFHAACLPMAWLRMQKTGEANKGIADAKLGYKGRDHNKRQHASYEPVCLRLSALESLRERTASELLALARSRSRPWRP